MADVFPKSMTIKQAVVSTLAYFDLFDVPLSAEEIYENLFFLPLDKKKVDIYLRESPQVHVHDGYYSLKRNDAFYAHFAAKRRRAKEFWKRVQRFQWLFNLCPFVRMVAVCNSLPITAVEDDSDIDLLVVTDKNRMFTARFFLTLFTSLFFVRRFSKFIRKRFCLSFYVTEDNLNLSALEQKPYDIYLAYWTKTLEPVAGDYSIYEELMNTNKQWLEPYFQNIHNHRRRYRSPKRWHKRWQDHLERWFGDEKLEIKLRNWQLKRANEKWRTLPDPSGTVISDKMLKFHDRDIRATVRHEWVARIDEFL